MEKKPVQKNEELKSMQAVLEKTSEKAKSSVSRAITAEKNMVREQDKVEDAKFFMSQEKPAPQPIAKELPSVYHENKIVLMVVDPWWAHSYWEVTSDKIQEGLRFLRCELYETKTVLRVFDVSGQEGSEKHNHFYDIEINSDLKTWYLNLNAPDRSFRVEIGLLTPDGRFYTLARSNTITMPRSTMSDVVDEKWMTADFEKMYALSGGLKVGASSIDLKDQMEKRFQELLSSGAVSSFGGSPVKRKERSFWFVLDCELIVYGATEPDAQVTVSGRPVQLRPDGTFTLRYALPDGRFPIPATARSADGKEERTITPVVQRNTEVSQPIVRE